MTAPPTASSRSTARREFARRRDRAAATFLAGHGLLFERVDVARCVELEPALDATSAPRWPARSTSRATRSATATSSRKAWPPPAPRRGATLPLRDNGAAASRPPAAGSRASSPTRAASRPTRSSSRWAASPRRCCAQARHPRADLSGEGRVDHLPARRLERRAADAGDRRQQAVRPGADRRPHAHLRLGRDHRLRHHAGRRRGARPSSPMPAQPSPSWRAISNRKARGSGPACGR